MMKVFTAISHLPTVILIVGYITYWLELYLIKSRRGVTTPLAYVLVISTLIYQLLFKKKEIWRFFSWINKEYKKQEKFIRCALVVSFILILLMLTVVLWALMLPPHLIQESDALNYHLALPRQHLIIGSFRHITWSTNDLFLLPIQFSLAPYYLIKDIPGKFINIFFVFALLAVSVNLARRFGRNPFLSGWLVTVAILGSHCIGIQMPLMMLDIILCYLFLAFLDSFVQRKFIVSAIELAFVVWAKPFAPMQMSSLFLFLLALYFITHRLGFTKVIYTFTSEDEFSLTKKGLATIINVFLITSIIIAGPFIIKSLYYAGTPLFPFKPGILNIFKSNLNLTSLWEASSFHLMSKDNYGMGRSVISFLRHLWLIAVPDKGQVINRYDYPLGLPYLLFVAPFFCLLYKSIRNKEYVIFANLVIVYWLGWWFGSQQARFLYVPLVLIFISVSSVMDKPSRILISVILCALLFNFISVFRANYYDFGLPLERVLREKDRNLISMNKEYLQKGYSHSVVLNYSDIAYAQFPVEVKIGDNDRRLPFVFK